MNPSAEKQIEETLTLLRAATLDSPYEGKLFLVGGLIRDSVLGVSQANDLDLVLEGDAPALALFLYAKGVALHYPVCYPRFGTAMVHVGRPGAEGGMVELVSARSEVYRPDSRKPSVQTGTLKEDAFRRDFTLNTLMENLHTGERLDLTGRGFDDLKNGIIRTPLDPRITFFDDPLRMLRAVRFAARFGFAIAEETRRAIQEEAARLAPPAISHERIRDEFTKILNLPGVRAKSGVEALLSLGLLEQFLPEMVALVGRMAATGGVEDDWTQALTPLDFAKGDLPLETRLALIWRDLEGGSANANESELSQRSAERARKIMNRLKFSNDEIRVVVARISLCKKPREYRPDWTDAMVRRFIRACHPHTEQIFTMAKLLQLAKDAPKEETANLTELQDRVAAQNAITNVALIASPLDGNEIMDVLGVEQGVILRRAKDFLTEEVIEGRLEEGNKEDAAARLLEWRKRLAVEESPPLA